MPALTEKVEWSLRDEIALKFMQALISANGDRAPSAALTVEYARGAFVYANGFLAARKEMPNNK